MQAILALEDGRVFHGRSFGAPGERSGEVVFQTAMVGYQEVLTDPSYRGQIVAMTCPEIGNCGTNALDQESERPQVAGFVVREFSVWPSSWRARQTLPQYLREHGIPAIAEIDTRALTRHIRSCGALKAMLSTTDHDAESLVRKARAAPALEAVDWVAEVTCGTAHAWKHSRVVPWNAELHVDSRRRLRCVAYDFGIKHNILRLLQDGQFDVTVVPASTTAAEVLALEPHSVFLSNGPGDPAVLREPIREVRELIGRVPIFGICLGHQIAALALGAKTFKLKFGHRGANHPVLDLATGRVAVTCQNHGYAVDPDSLPGGARVTHLNLNDQTLEGFRMAGAGLMAVQYHPEASPGPHDSHGLFREFHALVRGTHAARGRALEAEP